MSRVLCVGESMVLVATPPGIAIEDSEHATLSVAGAESNTAQTLAELGHDVAWVSRVGADSLGTKVIDAIGCSGVNTSMVNWDAAAPTGVFFKSAGVAGTSVHYFRSGSAASRLAASDLEGIDFADIDLVHVTGVTPALSLTCRAMVGELIHRASAVGATISFDVNYRPALWDVQTAAPVLRGLAERSDVVFVGRDEAQVLWETVTAEDVRSLLPDVRLVVKDAEIGATAYSRTAAVFEPAIPVEVVEPVGAGDAFAAGVLSAMLSGSDDESALKMGHRVAALALSTTGDRVDASKLLDNPAGAR